MEKQINTHYIGKTDTFSSKNDFSIFENTNSDLKRKISEFKVSNSDEVKMGWPSKTWKIIEQDGEEVKCQEGRNITYFKLTDIEEALKDKLEYERNQKFKAFEHFKEAFGVISLFRKHEGHMMLRKIDLQNCIGLLGRRINLDLNAESQRVIDTRGVEGYDTFYAYELNSYKGIEISASASGGTLNLFFNSEGNYVNRDYNEDILMYSCEDISPTIIFKEFEKRILAIKNLNHSKGKYYTDTHCYIPYFYEERGDLKSGVEIVPIRYDKKTYQHMAGETIYKKPAVLEKSTSKEMLNDIKNKMTRDFTDLFNISNLQEATT